MNHEEKQNKFAREEFLKNYGINKNGFLTSIAKEPGKFKRFEENVLKTGFPSLNSAVTNGGISADLIVLGGMPGSGKTSLVIQLGLDIAELNNVPFILYSLEMSRKRLIERMLCTMSGLSKRELQGKSVAGSEGTESTFAEGDLEKLKKGSERLKELSDRVFIIDRKDEKISWAIERLSEEVRDRLQKDYEAQNEAFFKELEGDSPTRDNKEKVPDSLWRTTIEDQIDEIKSACNADTAFVAIDHLQIFPLVEYELDRNGNFRQNHKVLHDERVRLVALMQKFARVKDRQNISLLLVSQLNRQGYAEPSLNAFLGSATIEYLADLGLALVDPGCETEGKNKKGPDLVKIMKQQEESSEPRVTDLVVLKNRDGIVGRIPMKFQPKVFRFWENV